MDLRWITFIDTGGALFEVHSLFSKLGILWQQQASDYAFRDVSFDDVTNPDMLKMLIELYIGEKKSEDVTLDGMDFKVL